MIRALVLASILTLPFTACDGSKTTRKDRAYVTCSKIMDISLSAGDQAGPEKIEETNSRCAEEMRKTQSRSAELFDPVEKCVATQTDFDGFKANCMTMLAESGL